MVGLSVVAGRVGGLGGGGGGCGGRARQAQPLSHSTSIAHLKALHQLALANLVGVEPPLEGHVITKGVLGDHTATAAANAGRVEVVDERAAWSGVCAGRGGGRG